MSPKKVIITKKTGKPTQNPTQAINQRPIIPLNMSIPDIDELIREDIPQPTENFQQVPEQPKKKKPTPTLPTPTPTLPTIKTKITIKKRTPEETKNVQIAKIAKENAKIAKAKKDVETLLRKPNKKIKEIYNPILGKNVKKNKRNLISLDKRKDIIEAKIEEGQNKFIELVNEGKEDKIQEYVEQLTEIRFSGETRFYNPDEDLIQIITAIDEVFTTNDRIKIIVKPETTENEIIITWSDNTKRDIISTIENTLTSEILDGYSFSEAIGNIFRDKIEYMEIIVPEFNEPRKRRKGGAFFPYYNITNFDLSRYGIYKEDDKPDYNENCLLYSLRMLKMSEEKLNNMKLLFNSREIPQCKLKEICEKMKFQINLRNGNFRNTVKFGDSNEQYNLGLLENHYFINEDMYISNYCIENYNEVKEIKDCNLIIKKRGKYYEKKKDIQNSSYNVISKFIENKETLLKPVEKTYEMMATPYYKNLEIGINLNYPDECCKLTNEEQNNDDIDEDIETKKTIKYEVIYIDIETPKNKKSLYCPFVLVSEKRTETKKTVYIGLECVRNFLNSLKIDTMLIAHNMGGFDGSFFIKHLLNINECNNGNNTLSIKGKYYNPITKKTINIFLKDSFTLIHMSLSKFPKCFFTKEESKNIKKEVFPHNQMLLEDILANNGLVNIEEAYKHIKENQIKQFNKNLDEWKLRRNNGKYDILKYCTEYCKIDVDILKKGYEKFRNDVLNALNFDIDDVLTIASLADKYLISRGCYDDVYQLSGIPREYIQKCLVGGRTMTRANKKFVIESKIVPLDANSLYPSAISQMGYLQGKPKILDENQKTLMELNKFDGYFIRIKINKVNKKFDFPLLSYLDNKGIRQFTNELEGYIIYIDKIALEDAIKWHKIEFDILDGYYFNNGFNYKCKDVIKELYQKRLKYKNEDNPIELVYKEILNCSYGKTILKPSEYKIVYLHSQEKFNDYFSYNYNYIVKVNKINGYFPVYRLKVINPVNNHFSRPHIGISILSMSKRIMNNTMCLAEENNINMWYQDTDSIYINEMEISKLEEIYKNTYNKNLIGDELGQFKRDFKLEYGEPDKNGERKTSKNVWSDYSIFLGKKSYYNELKGLTPEKQPIEGVKITLKGISGDSVKTYTENNKTTERNIFKNLLIGGKNTFDLLCKDVEGIIRSCKMKRNFDKSIKMVDDNFDREISFSAEMGKFENNKFEGGYRV
jgi:hypothetical protein